MPDPTDVDNATVGTRASEMQPGLEAPCRTKSKLGTPSVAFRAFCLQRRNVHEKGIDHRGQRLQRRRGHPGGSQDHDLPGRVRHERHYRPHRPEHHRACPACLEAAPEFVEQQLDCVFRGHPARRGEDRHGVQPGHHPGHRPAKLRAYRAGAHCGGPGDGGHQRLQPYAGQRPGGSGRGALPPGGGDHPQHSGGGAAVRLRR